MAISSLRPLLPLHFFFFFCLSPREAFWLGFLSPSSPHRAFSSLSSSSLTSSLLEEDSCSSDHLVTNVICLFPFAFKSFRRLRVACFFSSKPPVPVKNVDASSLASLPSETVLY